MFESKWRSTGKSKVKFEEKYSEWLQSKVKLITCYRPPKKQYEDLGKKSDYVRHCLQAQVKSFKKCFKKF